MCIGLKNMINFFFEGKYMINYKVTINMFTT